MISVQNLYDSSRSRTLRTRWLRPTGVTALLVIWALPSQLAADTSIECLPSHGQAPAALRATGVRSQYVPTGTRRSHGPHPLNGHTMNATPQEACRPA